MSTGMAITYPEGFGMKSPENVEMRFKKKDACNGCKGRKGRAKHAQTKAQQILRPKTPSLLKGKCHAPDSQGANQRAEGNS